MESYCSAQAGLICDIKSGLFEMLHIWLFIRRQANLLIFFSQLFLPKINDVT